MWFRGYTGSVEVIANEFLSKECTLLSQRLVSITVLVNSREDWIFCRSELCCVLTFFTVAVCVLTRCFR
ncbi:hypothetical protein NPIL_221841 [Nephila pilipes]|uniref:Uncharacterized protein n=1 Tax=Nephila pilipes TaxID=299642 RepID=A0A8X6T0I2_NEPPI|nr:hypothetical protein NPIL_221841 [Nephila pilipes]